jgi:hypothetical protein
MPIRDMDSTKRTMRMQTLGRSRFSHGTDAETLGRRNCYFGAKADVHLVGAEVVLFSGRFVRDVLVSDWILSEAT